MRKARPVRRTDEDKDVPTEPRAVAEGRGKFSLSPASARAIADATTASGFPVPANVQAVLDDQAQSAPATPPVAQTEEG